MPRRRKPVKSGWFTRQQMALMFDVTPHGFDKCVRRMLPPDAIRGEGKDLEFHGRSAIDAYAEVNAPRETGPMKPDDLARWRRSRADLLEIEVAAKRESSVPIEEVVEFYNRLADTVRRAGELIQRNYGREPFAILEEALLEMKRECKECLKDDGGSAAE